MGLGRRFKTWGCGGGDIRTDAYTRPCWWEAAVSTGSSAWPSSELSDDLEGWHGDGDGRDIQEGGDIYIPMADSY